MNPQGGNKMAEIPVKGLLRPLYHDQGSAHPDSGHHPHDQHLCNFQSGGVHGKGALRLPAPAGGSGQGC